jgi:hypothetical protein
MKGVIKDNWTVCTYLAEYEPLKTKLALLLGSDSTPSCIKNAALWVLVGITCSEGVASFVTPAGRDPMAHDKDAKRTRRQQWRSKHSTAPSTAVNEGGEGGEGIFGGGELDDEHGYGVYAPYAHCGSIPRGGCAVAARALGQHAGLVGALLAEAGGSSKACKEMAIAALVNICTAAPIAGEIEAETASRHNLIMAGGLLDETSTADSDGATNGAAKPKAVHRADGRRRAGVGRGQQRAGGARSDLRLSGASPSGKAVGSLVALLRNASPCGSLPPCQIGPSYGNRLHSLVLCVWGIARYGEGRRQLAQAGAPLVLLRLVQLAHEAALLLDAENKVKRRHRKRVQRIIDTHSREGEEASTRGGEEAASTRGGEVGLTTSTCATNHTVDADIANASALTHLSAAMLHRLGMTRADDPAPAEVVSEDVPQMRPIAAAKSKLKNMKAKLKVATSLASELEAVRALRLGPHRMSPRERMAVAQLVAVGSCEGGSHRHSLDELKEYLIGALWLLAYEPASARCLLECKKNVTKDGVNSSGSNLPPLASSGGELLSSVVTLLVHQAEMLCRMCAEGMVSAECGVVVGTAAEEREHDEHGDLTKGWDEDDDEIEEDEDGEGVYTVGEDGCEDGEALTGAAQRAEQKLVDEHEQREREARAHHGERQQYYARVRMMEVGLRAVWVWLCYPSIRKMLVLGSADAGGCAGLLESLQLIMQLTTGAPAVQMLCAQLIRMLLTAPDLTPPSAASSMGSSMGSATATEQEPRAAILIATSTFAAIQPAVERLRLAHGVRSLHGGYVTMLASTSSNNQHHAANQLATLAHHGSNEMKAAKAAKAAAADLATAAGELAVEQQPGEQMGSLPIEIMHEDGVGSLLVLLARCEDWLYTRAASYVRLLDAHSELVQDYEQQLSDQARVQQEAELARKGGRRSSGKGEPPKMDSGGSIGRASPMMGAATVTESMLYESYARCKHERRAVASEGVAKQLVMREVSNALLQFGKVRPLQVPICADGLHLILRLAQPLAALLSPLVTRPIPLPASSRRMGQSFSSSAAPAVPSSVPSAVPSSVPSSPSQGGVRGVQDLRSPAARSFGQVETEEAAEAEELRAMQESLQPRYKVELSVLLQILQHHPSNRTPYYIAMLRANEGYSVLNEKHPSFAAWIQYVQDAPKGKVPEYNATIGRGLLEVLFTAKNSAGDIDVGGGGGHGKAVDEDSELPMAGASGLLSGSPTRSGAFSSGFSTGGLTAPSQINSSRKSPQSFLRETQNNVREARGLTKLEPFFEQGGTGAVMTVGEKERRREKATLAMAIANGFMEGSSAAASAGGAIGSGDATAASGEAEPGEKRQGILNQLYEKSGPPAKKITSENNTLPQQTRKARDTPSSPSQIVCSALQLDYLLKTSEGSTDPTDGHSQIEEGGQQRQYFMPVAEMANEYWDGAHFHPDLPPQHWGGTSILAGREREQEGMSTMDAQGHYRTEGDSEGRSKKGWESEDAQAQEEDQGGDNATTKKKKKRGKKGGRGGGKHGRGRGLPASASGNQGRMRCRHLQAQQVLARPTATMWAHSRPVRQELLVMEASEGARNKIYAPHVGGASSGAALKLTMQRRKQELQRQEELGNTLVSSTLKQRWGWSESVELSDSSIVTAGDAAAVDPAKPAATDENTQQDTQQGQQRATVASTASATFSAPIAWTLDATSLQTLSGLAEQASTARNNARLIEKWRQAQQEEGLGDSAWFDASRSLPTSPMSRAPVDGELRKQGGRKRTATFGSESDFEQSNGMRERTFTASSLASTSGRLDGFEGTQRAGEWAAYLEGIYAQADPPSYCPVLYPYWEIRLPKLYRSGAPPAATVQAQADHQGSDGSGATIVGGHHTPGANANASTAQYRRELYTHSRLIDGSIAVVPTISPEALPLALPPPPSIVPPMQLFDDRIPHPPEPPFPSRLNPPHVPRPNAPSSKRPWHSNQFTGVLPDSTLDLTMVEADEPERILPPLISPSLEYWKEPDGHRTVYQAGPKKGHFACKSAMVILSAVGLAEHGTIWYTLDGTEPAAGRSTKYDPEKRIPLKKLGAYEIKALVELGPGAASKTTDPVLARRLRRASTSNMVSEVSVGDLGLERLVGSHYNHDPDPVLELVAQPWGLARSVWKPRAYGERENEIPPSESRGYYDKEKVSRRSFHNDWLNIAKKVSFDSYILKLLGNDEQEMEQIRGELYKEYPAIVTCFEHYAALSASEKLQVKLNLFNDCCADCELADPHSKECKQRDLDNIFLLVNLETQNEELAHKTKEVLSRYSIVYTRSDNSVSTV